MVRVQRTALPGNSVSECAGVPTAGGYRHRDPKRKLLISQFTTGLTTNTSKRPPSAEKLFVSRRNSSNSKRDSSFSFQTLGLLEILLLCVLHLGNSRLPNSRWWKQRVVTNLPVTATRRTAKEGTIWRTGHQLREMKV